MSILGDRVRNWRIKRGLSQTELGKLAGISQQSIDKIESGETQNPRHIVELAIALNVSPAYLKNHTDDPTPEPQRRVLEDAVKNLPENQVAAALEALRRLRGE